MKIHETRSSNINDVIVSIDNVRKIAHFFLDLYNNTSEKDRSSVSFKVNCDDGSHYSSSTLDIFADDSPILLKKPTSIDITFSSYQNNLYANFTLQHGESDRFNRLLVSGEDSSWVNGTLRLGQEIISSLKPQNNYIRRFKTPVLFLFSLSCGIIMFQVLYQTMKLLGKINTDTTSTDTEFNLFHYLLAWMLLGLFGSLPAFTLYEKLNTFWPNVELQIGPEHKWIENKRRLWLSTAFLIGVAPMLSQLVYSLIKALIAN